MARLKTEGLTNYDVADALGVATLDVGSLCASDQINKWSKDKPIALNNEAEPNYKDTPKDLKDVGYNMALFTQGQYKKPYGLYPVKVLSVGSTGVGLPKSDVWDYVRLEIGQLEGNEDKVVWATTDADGNRLEEERWARLPDFCGYDHYAIPPAQVEWIDTLEITEEEYDPDLDEDVIVTKKIKGVFAKIKVPAADSGSVSFKDLMGKDEAYALFVTTTEDGKFAYGNSANALNDSVTEVKINLVTGGEYIVGLSNRKLSDLSGRFAFTIVIADKLITYANGSEGWDSGISFFYPIASSYPTVTESSDNGYVVEGGMVKKQVNSLQGTTLFMTDGLLNRYAKITNAVGLSGYTPIQLGNKLEGEENRIFNYLQFNADNNPNDLYSKYRATINVNEKVTTLMRGITFSSYTLSTTDSIAQSSNYLVYCFANNTLYTGYKPLLKGLKIKNPSGYTMGYEMDIYLQIEKDTTGVHNAVISLKYQVRNLSNQVVKDSVLFSYSGEIKDVLYSLSFWNEIDERKGNLIGFKYGGYVGYAGNGGIPEYNKIENIRVELDSQSCYPFIPNMTNGGNGGYKYGDVEIALPDNLKASQCMLGGQMKVDYGIYNAGDRPSSRGDMLNTTREDVIFPSAN